VAPVCWAAWFAGGCNAPGWRLEGEAPVLRYRLAKPCLAGLRAWHLVTPARRAGFRTLLFHDVGAAALPAFEALLDEVSRAGGVIAPADAEAWLSGEVPAAADRGAFLLAFDDGFASNHQVAMGALAERGFRALFFVCPGLMDLTGEAQRAAIAANVFEGRLRGPTCRPRRGSCRGRR